MRNDEKNGVEVSVTEDRLTYWESRQINIGHYDSRHFGISYTKNINLKDKTVTINAKRESNVSELSESMGFVKAALDTMEAKIREKTDSYVDHDSIDKINDPELKSAAIERRNRKRARSNEGAQRFKDKINNKETSVRGSRTRRGRNFLDE